MDKVYGLKPSGLIKLVLFKTIVQCGIVAAIGLVMKNSALVETVIGTAIASSMNSVNSNDNKGQ